MDENNYIEKQLSDHESRIRRLEESDIQQRIQLTNIEKSQSDIKLMMSEQSKEQLRQTEKQQNMLNKFTTQMIDYFKERENKELENKAKEKEIDMECENNKINNEIKFYNTKQFWIVICMILGGILGYLGLK